MHVAHVIEVEQCHVERLRPRFEFRLRESLQEAVFGLGEGFERLELEEAERTQLVLEHRVVRIRGIRCGRRAALGLTVRIARRRAFQEYLRKRLAHLGIGRLVALAIADAEVLFAGVGLVALRLSVVTEFLFLLEKRVSTVF